MPIITGPGVHDGRERPSLAGLDPGESAVVGQLVGPVSIRRRLAEMGLVPGVTATVERLAPLGDPMEIAVRGYRLSLRRDQAACLILGNAAHAVQTAEPVSSAPAPPLPTVREPVIALAGNPNAGKTTLFNAITGMRQQVGNYPGVTVDRKEGLAPLVGGRQARIIDLPGIYSLIPSSPDERIAVEVLAGLRADTAMPDMVLAVIDASNLARNLLLATQLLDTGLPMVIALTMVDEARARGIPVDADGLSARLGVPVIPVVASTGEGLLRLREVIGNARSVQSVPWSGPVLEDHDRIAEVVLHQARAAGRELSPASAKLIAWALLGEGDFTGVLGLGAIEPLIVAVAQARARWAASGIDPVLDDIARRYAWIDALLAGNAPPARRLARDRIDAVLLHRVWGPAAFALVMWGLFVAIFTLAAPIMDAAEQLVLWLGAKVGALLPDGLISQLWHDGIVSGVGGVIIFVPQIAFMFILLAVLDESGYLARGAFLLDRVLGKVGLHGRSFVPLLSSHACAIPGIMAARTIPDARERLATMLVAPFMSCSARLPVYGLLIGVFFVHLAPWQQGTIMAALYLGGIVTAGLVAWALRSTVLRGPSSSFLIELPPYRLPSLGEIARVTGRAVRAFLVRAGTIILAFTVLLWAAMTFPRLSEDQVAAITAATPAEQVEPALQQASLEHSLAGRTGRLIEPVIAPLGMDWQVGIGLIGAFAAREVFVSTLGVVHGVGGDDQDTTPLAQRMQEAKRPDGTPLWSPLLAVVTLAWFVLAMQCLSTVAVMVRETGGWRWPLIQLVGMNGLAWFAGFLIWQIGSRVF